VSAKLLYQTRDDKIRVFRKNRRKHYERTKGHRQYITILKVLSIKSSIGEEVYKEPAKRVAKPETVEKKEINQEVTEKKVTVKKTTTKKATSKVKE
jgi:large subunit ribosomal protein L21